MEDNDYQKYDETQNIDTDDLEYEGGKKYKKINDRDHDYMEGENTDVGGKLMYLIYNAFNRIYEIWFPPKRTDPILIEHDNLRSAIRWGLVLHFLMCSSSLAYTGCW